MVCGRGRSEPSPLGLHVASCSEGKARIAAACGTFGVYENRASHAGRIISLRLVVLRAVHRSRRAIFFVPGGPGQSAVSLASAVADGEFGKPLMGLRDRYDVVFVDNRGMGQSHPFACTIDPRSDPRSYFRQLWPDRVVKECRRKASATSDPNLYNTNNAVDDLDAVRAALHYPAVVLYGGSYGTFFSFVYMRRHPNNMESAVLLGVDPPHFAALPGAPDGAQTALDDLFAKCRRHPVCRSHFPRFAQHFGALLARFDRGPVSVPVKIAQTNGATTVALSKEVLVDRLRQTLYDPEGAATIPSMVERAYGGDYAALADMVERTSEGFAAALDTGAFLSYSCADLMPFISQRALREAAAHSFVGDLRVRAQRRACGIWNVQPMPAHFNDPVRSATPVLMVSGSDDPATPPQYAELALPYLPNGKIVLVRGAGHVTETPCTDGLIAQFVHARSVRNLDGSRCRSAFVVPNFTTSP